MAVKKVAVIEDEPDILDILVYNLGREGFDVVSAENGEEGLALVRQKKPDIVLLDLMLPGIDGLEICRRLKTEAPTSSIPVILVTAKGEESDVVLGLGLGADDYVIKPFSPRELVARVKAVLRRGEQSASQDKNDRIEIDGLLIDASKYKVMLEGQEISFTATEFGVLFYLASHPGRVFTREQLINKVLGDVVVVDRNIDVHVRAIRKKLGSHQYLVETIRGVGYRFKEN
ncbi:MAG: response regulator [Pseudomonadales bacterium]|nr:response regulator [Pseudomonadales bacterium]